MNLNNLTNLPRIRRGSPEEEAFQVVQVQVARQQRNRR